MTEIELVIRIDEEDFNKMKYNVAIGKPICSLSEDKMVFKVANGTPLPKGHGKIIDVNDLLDRIGLKDNESNREENVGEIVTLEDFDYIPTIIPADTESEGEE